MSEIPMRPVNGIKASESAQDRLVAYAEKQIENMRSYCELGNGSPGFEELNRALTTFNDLYCSLVGIDVIAKTEYQNAKNAFEEFMADKYMEAREILNPTTIAASKWASSKEIEYYVQVHWKDQYIPLRDEMNAAEKKVALARRLLDGLDSYKFNVNTLCRNVQTEMMNMTGLRDLEG